MIELVNRLRLSSKPYLPMIKQMKENESFLACVTMVSNYHGLKVEMNTFRQKLLIPSDTLTYSEISTIFTKINFSVREVEFDIASIKSLSTPCILKLDKIFAVLKRIKNNVATIHHPVDGVIQLKLPDLIERSNSSAFEVTPTIDFRAEKTLPKAKLSSFWSNVIGLKRTLGKILLLSLLLQVFVLATPYYVQTVMDDVLVAYDIDLLKILAFGFILLLLLQVLTQSIRSIIIAILGNQLSVQMSSNLISHLYKLPINYFEKRHIGDVVSRVGSLEQIRKLLTTTIVESLVDGLMIIGILSVMLFYSVKLTLIVTGFTLVYLTIRYFLFPYFKKLQRNIITIEANKDTNLMESIKGIQAIKLYNQESDRLNMFNNLNVDNSNESIKFEKLNIAFNWINDLLSGLQHIVVIYFAAKLVIAGQFSVGMIFAFLAYRMQFNNKAINLIDRFIEFKMISLHLERLGDISLTEKEQNIGHYDKNVSINGELRLKNLTFSYSPNENFIFKDLNLTINKGDSVAIIGPSGCGKSTLLKIMIGLLRANSGEVIVDDKNIYQIGLRNYRANVSSVMQNEKLMSGTILENISFFESHPIKSKVEDCAIKAGIHWDILSMPKGYQSLIGDMGNTLSGGQVQRIILARALYRDPKILFLDEATSNLDFDLENHINKSIKNLEMTRIFIAHRPETIKSADRIIQYENGTFVEMSNEELAKIKSKSYSLV